MNQIHLGFLQRSAGCGLMVATRRFLHLPRFYIEMFTAFRVNEPSCRWSNFTSFICRRRSGR
jgi:hypothetical protein